MLLVTFNALILVVSDFPSDCNMSKHGLTISSPWSLIADDFVSVVIFARRPSRLSKAFSDSDDL